MCKSWNRIGTGRKVILIFPSQRKNNKTVRVLKTPKTDTSERKVYIPGFVAQCLIDIKKEQDEVKEALGSEYTDYNLIMATTFGMPINGSYIRDQMQKVIDKEGLPDVVFHSLRHTSVESIVVFVRCSRSMKFKPVIFPKLLKFSHIFSTKYFGDHLNRKKKTLSRCLSNDFSHPALHQEQLHGYEDENSWCFPMYGGYRYSRYQSQDIYYQQQVH